MIFMVFLWLHHENQVVDNFHYYIRDQHIKLRKCGEFHGNQKVYLFRAAPLMGFGSFF